MAALRPTGEEATSDSEAVAKFDTAIANAPNAEDLASEVRRLVGYVVFTAKKKDGRDWRWESIQKKRATGNSSANAIRRP